MTNPEKQVINAKWAKQIGDKHPHDNPEKVPGTKDN
jgi:hypothetical protein